MHIFELASLLETLPAYEEVKAAEAQVAAARAEVPQQINLEYRSDLQAQLRYLESKNTYIGAAHLLQYEIAQQGERLMPLTHTLGSLAAYGVLIDELKPRPARQPGRPAQPDSASHFAHMDPIARGARLGNALAALQGELDTDERLEVCMVRRFSAGCLNDEVVTGALENPRTAYTLSRPRIENWEVDYELPIQLSGVVDLHYVGSTQPMQNKDSYTNPVVPIIAKLLRRYPYDSPSELLFGAAARSQVSKTEAEREERRQPSRLVARRRRQRR